MWLGIISDTHGFYHPEIPEVFEDVDLILHAGDLGRVEILRALEDLAPVRAVYGNVDGGGVREATSEHERFEIEGLSFWMTHIGGRPGRWDRRVRDRLNRAPPDVLVCGHSHILQVEHVDDPPGMLFVNPGAAGRHGFHQEKTCLRMLVEGGKAREVEVVHLDRSDRDPGSATA